MTVGIVGLGLIGGSFAKAHLVMWKNVQRILEHTRPTNVVNGL